MPTGKFLELDPSMLTWYNCPMNPQMSNYQNYQQLARTQQILVRDVEQLKTKIELLGSVDRWNALTRRTRAFAKKHKIKPSDVLKDD